MKIGDVVVYTPPDTKLVPPYDGAIRYVVVGVIPETDSDNELVWLCGVSNTEAKPEEVTIEEALDCTVVDAAPQEIKIVIVKKDRPETGTSQ